MNTAVPDRGFPVAVQYREHFGKHGTTPPCPTRGPEAGNPHICVFHGSGVNSQSSYPFLQEHCHFQGTGVNSKSSFPFLQSTHSVFLVFPWQVTVPLTTVYHAHSRIRNRPGGFPALIKRYMAQNPFAGKVKTNRSVNRPDRCSGIQMAGKRKQDITKRIIDLSGNTARSQSLKRSR